VAQTIGRAYRHGDGIIIKTTAPPMDNLSDEVTVIWHDKRSISPEQRRKAWALIGEIARHCGYLSQSDKRQMHQELKAKFLAQMRDVEEPVEMFSLRDTDMTTAREYITFLVEICIEFDVPTKEPLWQMAEDVEAYVYQCAIHGVCAVCRRHAGMHHVDAVGMGRNRRRIGHVGLMGISLCWGVRGHHFEAHQLGDAAFMDKYLLAPIEITKEIAIIYKLRAEADEELLQALAEHEAGETDEGTGLPELP